MSAGHDFVMTDTEAVGMLPPKVVCEFQSTNMAWSPDGRYVLLLRDDPKITVNGLMNVLSSPKEPTPPDDEESVMLVDVAKGTSTKIWSVQGPYTKVLQIAWLSGTDVGYFTTINVKVDAQKGEARRSGQVFAVNAGLGKAQLLYQGAQDEDVSIHLSPLLAKGLLILQRYDPETSEMNASVMEVQSNGLLGKRTPLPEKLSWMDVQWTDDGARPLFMDRRQMVVPAGQTAPATQFLFDVASAKLQPVNGLRTYRPKPDAGPLYVEIQKGEAKSGSKTEETHVAWLKSRVESKMSSALIVADGYAVLSPTQDAILSFQQGVVMLRPLVRMPREVYEKALAAAERTRLISDAKQCALAFIMYGADNDDDLPQGGDWQSQIYPYVKNNDVINGFVFTLSGANLGKVENPASTEIGYKLGPGGRAVAYADGHVKWIPDP